MPPVDQVACSKFYFRFEHPADYIFTSVNSQNSEKRISDLCFYLNDYWDQYKKLEWQNIDFERKKDKSKLHQCVEPAVVKNDSVEKLVVPEVK